VMMLGGSDRGGPVTMKGGRVGAAVGHACICTHRTTTTSPLDVSYVYGWHCALRSRHNPSPNQLSEASMSVVEPSQTDTLKHPTYEGQRRSHTPGPSVGLASYPLSAHVGRTGPTHGPSGLGVGGRVDVGARVPTKSMDAGGSEMGGPTTTGGRVLMTGARVSPLGASVTGDAV
jgi:hypothetical protein